MIDARRLWEVIRARPLPASISTLPEPLPGARACSGRELDWLQAGGATLVVQARVRQSHAPAASAGAVRAGAPTSLVLRHATRYLLVPVVERALVFHVHVVRIPIASQFLSA